MTNVLEIENLSFSYGDISALHNINISVKQGEIVALLGANGAGKTTTLKSLSGVIRGITGGKVYFQGRDITGEKSWNIAKMGIAHCLEGRHIFSQLTVKENLQMGAFLLRKDVKQKDFDHIYKMFPRLKERENQAGGTLSGGEQQMLALGRALMQNPKLLLLDEPSLGLAPKIIQEIFEIIKRINDDGVPVLLVEQNTKAALKIAHRGYIIETGNIVMEDKATNLLDNEQVKKSYIGM